MKAPCCRSGCRSSQICRQQSRASSRVMSCFLIKRAMTAPKALSCSSLACMCRFLHSSFPLDGPERRFRLLTPIAHLHGPAEVMRRGESQNRVRVAADLLIKSAEVKAASGLQRLHAKFAGDGLSLAEIAFSSFYVARCTACAHFTQ